MGKRARQYIGLVVAVVLYYTIHEGAHLLVALAQGVFKQINIIGLGMQIDVYAEQMSQQQMAVFCLAGPLATLIVGWAMVLFVKQICAIRSAVVKACAWYTSITMLMLDELYLGVFYRWVGGGDMNGIKLMLPEGAVSAVAIVIGIVNMLIIWKILFPAYKKSFATEG
ncbi:MAG: hypothetical protein J6C60_05525 [Alistipes sp.]|nr:hypothetical protein [Alistipes sp.]MBO5400000.1 hypothetical protein [Alistipes sp.]